jgi:actin-like ATPase involved in cell morphogenesis
MGYSLGIDLGTTFSAAAVVRDGRPEVVNLGTRSAQVPSVVFVEPTGETIVGDAAEGRAATEPTRVAREFKRRLGDTTPLFLGGAPFSAEVLSAALLRAIYARVVERMGSAPEHVVVTHPAAYTQYRLDLLRAATLQAGIARVELLAEPIAAAIEYAATAAVPVGEVVAVYDFGGGTFDTALLRRTAAGFDLLGEAQGLERLGGVDFDAAVVQHVDEALGGALGVLDPSDPAVAAQLGRLRIDARAAKESLSETTTTSVPVVLPGVSRQVLLTRRDLEAMVQPRLAETVQALHRAAQSAGITIEQISRILLVGGSSRIPLIRQQVTITTGRPVSADIDPEFAVVLGAARQAARAASVPPAAERARLVPPPPPGPPSMQRPASLQHPAGPVSPGPAAGLHAVAVEPGPGRQRTLMLAAVAAVVLVLVAAVVVIATRKDDKSAQTSTSTTSVAAGPATTAGTGTITGNSADSPGTKTSSTASTAGGAAPAPIGPVTLTAQVFWAGFEITNESLAYDPGAGTVTWDSRWRNIGPGPTDVFGTDVALHLGDQQIAGNVGDGTTIAVNQPFPIEVVFTGVPAGVSFDFPSIVIGASDQRQSTLVLDGRASSSDFMATVQIGTSLDVGNRIEFDATQLLLAPAGCSVNGSSVAFGPTSTRQAAAFITGTLIVPAESPVVSATESLAPGVSQQFQPTNPLDTKAIDAGTSTAIGLCFDIAAGTPFITQSGTYLLTITTTDSRGATAAHTLSFDVPDFPSDPCLQLQNGDITKRLDVKLTGPPIGVTESFSGFLGGASRVCQWLITSGSAGQTNLLFAVALPGSASAAVAFAAATSGTDPAMEPVTNLGEAAAFGVDTNGFAKLVVQSGGQILQLQAAGGAGIKDPLIALMRTALPSP